MGFHLHFSNQLEKLAEVLSQNFFTNERCDIFTPIYAIVGSPGMATFLKQQIGSSRHGGVSFMVQTPFVTNFIDQIIRLWLPPEQVEKFNQCADFFDATTLTLKISQLLQKTDFPHYSSYIRNPNSPEKIDQVRLLQLSSKLADLIDRCSFYRQELFVRPLPDQAKAPEELLQLIDGLQNAGYTSRVNFIQELLQQPPQNKNVLPHRIAVFGLNTLPPIVLEFFKHLAEFCEVDFYLLAPCEEYWGEIKNRHEQQRMIDRGDADSSSFAADHPLLAELGSSGRDFLNLLLETNLFCDEKSYFDAATPDSDSLLHQFQTDLRHNLNRNSTNIFTPLAGDDSLTIHRCYQMRREVEQLHEELQRLIADNHFMPRDILVITPDISSFAPLINAVFDQGPLKSCFAICDRPFQVVSQVAKLFQELFTLPRQRAGASEIMALLDYPLLREKFGIAENDRPMIAEFIEEAGICWGENAQERLAKCGVSFKEYSWDWGLDRLLLGTAVDDLSLEISDSTLLPAGNVENTRALVLGKLAEFVHRLFELRQQMQTPHTLPEWSQLCGKMITDFLASSFEYAKEINEFRHITLHLKNVAEKIQFTTPLTADAYLELLNTNFKMPGGKQSFLQDKITFCSFMPMRSVPVKVIALLGMGDNQFPRRDRQDAFALPGKRRLGDPSPAQEDRYMLLETLISAREKLLFFYTGYGVDGSERPPCIPLSEIADMLATRYNTFTHNHTRHAYDEANFSNGENSRYNAFSEVDRRTAEGFRALHQQSAYPEWPEVLLRDLPTSPAISAYDLAKILTNPCYELLKTRCNLDLTRVYDPQPDADVEPFKFMALQKIKLHQTLWNMELQDYPKDKQLKALQLSNRLPVGRLGEECFEEYYQHLRQLIDPPAEKSKKSDYSYWKNTMKHTEIFALDVQRPWGQFTGTVRGDASGLSQFDMYFNDPHKFSLVFFYIKHLLLTLQNESPTTSIAMFLNGAGTLFPLRYITTPEVAEEQLKIFCDLRNQALTRPLPLFPLASLAYAKAKNCDQEERIRKAQVEFVSNFSQTGDANDPAISYFYNAENFAQGDFSKLASLVYEPIWAGTEKTGCLLSAATTDQTILPRNK